MSREQGPLQPGSTESPSLSWEAVAEDVIAKKIRPEERDRAMGSLREVKALAIADISFANKLARAEAQATMVASSRREDKTPRGKIRSGLERRELAGICDEILNEGALLFPLGRPSADSLSRILIAIADAGLTSHGDPQDRQRELVKVLDSERGSVSVRGAAFSAIFLAVAIAAAINVDAALGGGKVRSFLRTAEGARTGTYLSENEELANEKGLSHIESILATNDKVWPETRIYFEEVWGIDFDKVEEFRSSGKKGQKEIEAYAKSLIKGKKPTYTGDYLSWVREIYIPRIQKQEGKEKPTPTKSAKNQTSGWREGIIV